MGPPWTVTSTRTHSPARVKLLDLYGTPCEPGTPTRLRVTFDGEAPASDRLLNRR